MDGAAVPAALGSYSIRGNAVDNSGTGLRTVEVSFDGGGTWVEASDTSGDGSLGDWVYDWTPLPLGTHSIMSRATDNLGGVENPSPGTHVTVDGSPPASTITFPSDGSFINGTICTVTGFADDGPGSGVLSVEMSVDGGASWEPASGTTSWSYVWALPADGVYTILSRATDRATNVETPGAAYMITVDNTPPTGVVEINDGAQYAHGSDVVLTLSAQDTDVICPDTYPRMCAVTEMRFSTDGIYWGPWEPAATYRTWDVGAGNGVKTVYVMYKDRAGNTSAAASDMIILDTLPPSSAITDPVDGTAVNSDFYDITGGADDGAGSGVGGVDVSFDGGQTWNTAEDASGDGSLSSWTYHWAPMPLGNHSITVRAVDNAGNMETPVAGVHLLVDRDAPASSIGYPADGAVLAGQTFTLTGASDDVGGAGVVLVEVSTDGGATWAAADGTALWSYEWTPPADGGYTILCRAVDAAGNAEAPGAGVAVIVDNEPPSSTITLPTPGEYLGGSEYTIVGTADDGTGSGVQTVEVTTDGGVTWNTATGTTSWSYTWTLPADGAYTIYSRATDRAANAETPAAGVAVTVDTAPPVSAVEYPADGALMNGLSSFTVTGIAADGAGSGVSEVEVSTDGGATWSVASGTSSWSFQWTPGPDGSHNIKSRATDNAGNVEAPGPGVNVTVDATPPSSTITSPIAGELIGGLQNYTVEGTASDGTGSGVSVVEVSTDGGQTWNAAAGTASWSYSWALPADGAYTVISRAADIAGNTEAPGPGVLVTVDTTPPAGSISLKGGKYTKARNVQLILSARDAGSDCPEPDPVMCAIDMMQLSADGVSWLPWETPSTTRSWHFSQGDGVKSIYVHYRDFAGNVSEDYITTAIVDTVAPSSAVTSPSGGAVIVLPVCTVTGTSNDAGSGVSLVEVSTDGGATWSIASGTADWTYQWTPGADGSYNITSRATDNAGNVENPGPGVTVTVSLDSTPPTGAISINAGAPYTNSTSAALTLSADDAGSGVTQMMISADGTFDTEPWEPYSSARGWALDSGDGLKELYVCYRDAAGNVSQTYTAGITLDTAPPVGSVVIEGGAEFTHSTSVNLGINATDGLSGTTQMQISEDALFASAQWEPYSADKVWDLSASEGVKTVYVRFMDAASNVSATVNDEINLNFDAVPPSSSITAPADGETLSGVTYTISGASSDSGTGVLKVEVSTDGGATWKAASGTSTWSYDWVLPVNGSPSIMSRATDNAGNTETPAAGVSVTVTAYGSPELQHYNWDMSASGGCAFCHRAQGVFLQADFMSGPGFCGSCHNSSGVAHDSCTRGDHGIMASVTTAGCRMPTYGNITAAEYNNRPSSRLKDGDKIVCVTCHNAMQKTEDYGRTWEMTTTGDNLTYSLERGGWSVYGYMEPRVYRDSALWAGPMLSKDKKDYLVPRSEYTYDEAIGTITFNTVQDPLDYIYVSLDYPYLRVSSQDNRLCDDCHTMATHMGANCLVCHKAHDTSNLAGIRVKVRTTDRTELGVRFLRYTGAGSFADGDSIHDGICEVCHTVTKYHRRDGSGFVNHSGGVDMAGSDCTTCHTHASGFAR